MKQDYRLQMAAMIIIVSSSIFILANLGGFYNVPLMLFTLISTFILSMLCPLEAFSVMIFLTMLFERFYTLQPIIVGRHIYKIYPLDFVLGGIIVGTIISLAIEKNSGGSWKKHFIMEMPDLLMTGFIILSAVYFLVSIFTGSGEFSLAFSSFKHYSLYPLLYFLVRLLLRKDEDFYKIFRFALAAGVLIIAFVIFGLVTGSGLWSEYTPLSTEGVRTLAFTHGFYLSLALIVLIAYLVSKKSPNLFIAPRVEETTHWILIGIWSIGIIGSMMRHLWGGLLLALAFLYILLPREGRMNLKKITLSLSFISLLVLLFVFYTGSLLPDSNIKKDTASVARVLYNRAQSLAHIGGDESFFWRNYVWKASLKEYAQNPIVGVGFGKSIPVEIEKYRELVEIRNIHNSWLVILVQLGVIGLTLLLGLVCVLLKKIVMKKNRSWIENCLPALMLFYFFVMQFQPYLETNMLSIFFWVILGMVRVKAYENIGNK